jgi:hypothetical protein
MSGLGIQSLPFYFQKEPDFKSFPAFSPEIKKKLDQPPKGEEQKMTLEKWETFWEKREKERRLNS